MDRQVFFDAVRSRPFGGRLTQQNVDGLTAILDEWQALFPGARWRTPMEANHEHYRRAV